MMDGFRAVVRVAMRELEFPEDVCLVEARIGDTDDIAIATFKRGENYAAIAVHGELLRLKRGQLLNVVKHEMRPVPGLLAREVGPS